MGQATKRTRENRTITVRFLCMLAYAAMPIVRASQGRSGGQTSSAPHERLAKGRHQLWGAVVGQLAVAEGGVHREAPEQHQEGGRYWTPEGHVGRAVTGRCTAPALATEDNVRHGRVGTGHRKPIAERGRTRRVRAKRTSHRPRDGLE